MGLVGFSGALKGLYRGSTMALQSKIISALGFVLCLLDSLLVVMVHFKFKMVDQGLGMVLNIILCNFGNFG